MERALQGVVGEEEVVQGKKLMSDGLLCCLSSSLQCLFIAAVTPRNASCKGALGGTAAVVVRGLHSCSILRKHSCKIVLLPQMRSAIN